MLKYNKKILTAITCGICGVSALVCGVACKKTNNDDGYKTGIVRVKQEKALYLSPVDDTLINCKISFYDTHYQVYYDNIQVGDTLTVHNPRDLVIMPAGRFDSKKTILNGKPLATAVRLRQIRREIYQR